MNNSKPLGLPTGSIRAIIALMVTVSTLMMVGLGVDIPDGLWAGFGAAIGFYFGQKVGK